MPKLIQIRNVPDDLHRRVKARASLAGLSLSDYLLREIRESLESPTPAELCERIASQSGVKLESSIVEILREERNSR